jgi:hypothetical protein
MLRFVDIQLREDAELSRWEYVLVGSALLMVAGLFLMLEGHVLGERTAGVASVLGLVGIILMLTSGIRVAMQKDRGSTMSV